MKPIYLDNNASTLPVPGLWEKLQPYVQEKFGNPASLHGFGRDVDFDVSEVRRKLLKTLEAGDGQVIFTSGGTETNNLAILGGFLFHHFSKSGKQHLVTSQIEHPSVLSAAKIVEEWGGRVTYLPCDQEGHVAPDVVLNALTDDTFMVSLIHASNEVGTLQPIEQITFECQKRGILVHSDTVQTVGKIPVSMADLGLDMASVSAHKFHGLKGTGALVVHERTVKRGMSRLPLYPLLVGGNQEHGFRAGTVNVLGIAALGTALEWCLQNLWENERKVKELYKKLRKGLEGLSGVVINTPEEGISCHTLSVAFPGFRRDELLILYDLEGIALSTGSACLSGVPEPSHVLQAMGKPKAILDSSLRISLSPFNTPEEIDVFLAITQDILSRKATLAKAGNAPSLHLQSVS